jgi:hypothetical protein
MQLTGAAMQQGQCALNELHQSIEANLQLAKHVETWEWKEASTANGEKVPEKKEVAAKEEQPAE